MENEAKNKSQVIIIIMLMIVIIGLSGYIVYNKGFKEPNEITEEENKETLPVDDSKEFDKEEAKKLVDKYYIDDERKFAGPDLYNAALKNVKSKEISCDILKDNKDFELKEHDIYYLKENSEYGDFFCSGEGITYDELNNAYKSLYGSNKNIQKKTFEEHIFSKYYYDSKNNTFISLIMNGGDLNYGFDIYAVKTAKTQGNKLIITIGKDQLEVKMKENAGTVIEYYYYNVDGKEIKFTSDEVDKDSFESDFINKYLDKMTTYTFNFEKENDNYVLRSITK